MLVLGFSFQIVIITSISLEVWKKGYGIVTVLRVVMVTYNRNSKAISECRLFEAVDRAACFNSSRVGSDILWLYSNDFDIRMHCLDRKGNACW